MHSFYFKVLNAKGKHNPPSFYKQSEFSQEIQMPELFEAQNPLLSMQVVLRETHLFYLFLH